MRKIYPFGRRRRQLRRTHHGQTGTRVSRHSGPHGRDFSRTDGSDFGVRRADACDLGLSLDGKKPPAHQRAERNGARKACLRHLVPPAALRGALHGLFRVGRAQNEIPLPTARLRRRLSGRHFPRMRLAAAVRHPHRRSQRFGAADTRTDACNPARRGRRRLAGGRSGGSPLICARRCRRCCATAHNADIRFKNFTYFLLFWLQ